MSVEIKTIGELIDELTVANLKIWHLVDRVRAGIASPKEAQLAQIVNDRRAQLVSAINKRLGDNCLAGKVYSD